MVFLVKPFLLTLLFSLFIFPTSFVQGIFFLAIVQAQMTLRRVKMLQVPTAAVLVLLLLWKSKNIRAFSLLSLRRLSL